MVRAKFVVISKVQNGEAYDILLSAVYDPTPGSENHEFWRWTPAGRLDLRTVNPKTAEAFEEGQEYYLDFSRVAARQQGE